MAADAFGIEVPADSDAFDPSGDMRDLASSLAGRIIVPVVNAVERDALAATLSPSAASPLYVHRADAPVASRTEWTQDGAQWFSICSENRGSISVVSSWVASSDRPLEWIQQGEKVHLFGSLSYNFALPASGQVTLSGIPPVGRRWDGTLRNGNTAIFTANVTTSGVLEWASRVGTGTSQFISLDGIAYRATA